VQRERERARARERERDREREFGYVGVRRRVDERLGFRV
jgi:hypothetical protein